MSLRQTQITTIRTELVASNAGVFHNASFSLFFFFTSHPMLHVEFCSEAPQPRVRRLRTEVDLNCQKAVRTLCCAVMTSLDRGKALYVKQESVTA